MPGRDWKGAPWLCVLATAWTLPGGLWPAPLCVGLLTGSPQHKRRDSNPVRASLASQGETLGLIEDAEAKPATIQLSSSRDRACAVLPDDTVSQPRCESLAQRV